MANIETTLPGGEKYSARAPNPSEWTRFVAHLHAGNARVGWRELIQVCSTSHTPDDAAALLAKYPGAVQPLGEAITEISAGEDKAKVEGDEVVFADMRFRAPTPEEWEEAQEAADKPRADQHAISLALLVKLCDTDGKVQARAAMHPGDVELVMSSVNKLAGAQIKIAIKKG